MRRQWTKKEINQWYENLGWLRGSNFLPSNVINRLDMFQSWGREEHLECADRELALHESVGFNTIRIWANFDVYYAEPRKFMDTLEQYVALAAKHHQRVMIVLAYEEDLPYGETFIPKKLGPQKLWHNHFNRDYAAEAEHRERGELRHYAEYPELKPLFWRMVTSIVKKYRHDERVFCWNVVNEPGIIIGDRAVPLLEELFGLVRSLNPDQPLCADVWRGVREDGSLNSAAEQKALELSDCISWHSYSHFDSFCAQLKALRRYGRPILCTEWLNRVNQNFVQDVYPYLFEENVASYCWGFVQGLTCTTEPWEHLWHLYDRGEDISRYDMRLWQHELFRANLRPYDPNEYEVLKKVNRNAQTNEEQK